jgi:hypothetical protein
MIKCASLHAYLNYVLSLDYFVFQQLCCRVSKQVRTMNRLVNSIVLNNWIHESVHQAIFIIVLDSLWKHERQWKHEAGFCLECQLGWNFQLRPGWNFCHVIPCCVNRILSDTLTNPNPTIISFNLFFEATLSRRLLECCSEFCLAQQQKKGKKIKKCSPLVQIMS